jgi:hypothetical protein
MLSSHYYGPCGTIPQDSMFGSEFGWPSADIMSVQETVTMQGGDDDKLRASTGGNTFLDYRSQIRNPDWTFDSMLTNGSFSCSTFPFALPSFFLSPRGTLSSLSPVFPPSGSTLTSLFPTHLDTRPKAQGGVDDGTKAGLERWLYLTQALQAHCVGGSVSAYRQHSEVMGAVNWAVNSIWTGAPAWGSISHDGKARARPVKHVSRKSYEEY